MGHREDVWDAEYFQNMLVGGIEWAGGKREIQLAKNLLAEAPDADVLPSQ